MTIIIIIMMMMPQSKYLEGPLGKQKEKTSKNQCSSMPRWLSRVLSPLEKERILKLSFGT